ncbi:MAG: hypothetical protein KKC51_03135 [Verrucomicrobia bacterium]|nr:hypothetical protein [Verrucomicrobiota bacterium]
MLILGNCPVWQVGVGEFMKRGVQRSSSLWRRGRRLLGVGLGLASLARAADPEPEDKRPVFPPMPAAALFAARQAVEPPKYEQAVLAEGLQGPDGLAVHPLSGEVFFSEEDSARVLVLRNGKTIPVITRDTPLYQLRDGRRTAEATEPLRSPEGLAFSPTGDLYVAEDYPGCRLVRFPARPDGRYPEGEVIEIPGNWRTFGWEGVAVGPAGDLLLAGSDIEYALGGSGAKPFMGAILYRDTVGQWWAPYRRPFASFSSVQFTQGGRQAVYTCEVSGEVGWLDLQGRRPLGGCSATAVKSPEGIAVMPDGRLMVSLETGALVCVDPAVDRHTTVADGFGSLESVQWDPFAGRLLLTEQAHGRVLALKARPDFAPNENRMDLAVYHPLFNPRHVPESCPTYLARILALGGLDYNRVGLPPLSFREFTERVPLIAADAGTVCLAPPDAVEDPLERVQFVVFKPNQMVMGETGPRPSLALFATRSRSGRITATSVLRAETLGISFDRPKAERIGTATLAVPTPAGVGVSALGIASIHFMGLGRTPDYSIVLNPGQPFESYLVVYQPGGGRVHYRLELSAEGAGLESWVVAFTESRTDEWLSLGR